MPVRVRVADQTRLASTVMGVLPQALGVPRRFMLLNLLPGSAEPPQGLALVQPAMMAAAFMPGTFRLALPLPSTVT
ncbi:hypothetical protein D3C79_797100 [compost metagenome]